MSKTIEQLEQEAKQAREALNQELTEICGAILAKPLVDKIIEASVAMVTYQFALGMQEVSGDGSGESLPKVSQEERDSDGWIEWNGGMQPIDDEIMVQVKFSGGDIDRDFARKYYWKHDICTADIIAYRIVKGE